jgi:NAD(P)H dehydrogenase (quinone)
MAKERARIIVTGATGGLGSEVIEALLRLAHPAELAVSTTDPHKAAPLQARGLRVRHGDFDRPETLDNAFEGAERLLIISTRAPGNERRFAQARNAIEAAMRGGVRHILYTSIVQRHGSRFEAAQGHLDTEAYLEARGASHTILRNGHYMENLPLFLGVGLATGDLALPPDGPTAWVARADLAEGIARLLLAEKTPPQSLVLTGSEALDFAQIAEIASRALGRPIRRRVIGPEEYIALLVGQGFPQGAASLLASGFASREAGELAIVDSALERLLGRPLRKLEEVLPELLARAAGTARGARAGVARG